MSIRLCRISSSLSVHKHNNVPRPEWMRCKCSPSADKCRLLARNAGRWFKAARRVEVRYDGSSWGSSERADSLSAYMTGGKTLQACQRFTLCSWHIVAVFLNVNLYGASLHFPIKILYHSFFRSYYSSCLFNRLIIIYILYKCFSS
jgi:hypothetical protein